MRSSTEPLQVLVVDDDPALLRTMADVLQLKGFAAATAQNGHRAIEVARTTPPAVALVDLRLPDMDGLDLVTRLHAGNALTEVVVLTGNASVSSAVRALREQIFDYLLKPVAPDQLVRTLDRAGERWRRRSAEAALATTERRFRSLIENATDLITILGQGGIVEYASPAYRSALGHAPESLLGTCAFDLVHADDVALLQEAIVGSATAGRRGAEVTVRLRDGGGRWRTFTGTVRDLSDDPAIRGVVFNARDVTEQHALELQLRQAQKMEAVGQLAGGIAHDFNNLLTVITSYSGMLLTELDGRDAIREDIAEIALAADRAAALTRQLLAFSRRQVLQPQPLELNQVIRDVEKLLRRLIREDIELVTALTPEPACVYADLGQLEQVLVNLVVNARDAQPRGGRIVIATANVELDEHFIAPHGTVTPGPHVMITVSDEGCGMDEATLARMYEPFFTTKGGGRGTGLGLATVYGIVQQSGGHIWCYSEPGLGTTFKIYLPRSAGAAAPASSTGVRAPAARGTETILLVEDEDRVRVVASRILRRNGYTVLEARTGPEALQLWREHGAHVDLVVTDMVMPEMGGRELAARVRQDAPELPLLFMSGYTEDGAFQRGVLQPGESYLEKPFGEEGLTRMVRRALAGG
ncbi:MAG TPA: response regulator [Gemmatimonadaceae bacterium]|nr:response regulator [Gemmatimonadaceae bacterium]